MQALLSVGPELQTCPPEALPTLLEFLDPMVLDPVQECCFTIEKIVKTAKLYCRQAIKLFEKNIYKYHSTPGKQRQDGSRESHIAQVVFDTKKEMSKAIYALSGTLNHAIAFKESFIMDKTKMFNPLMFPPVEFPLEEFKDIQIANLNQTLLRTINMDSRDFVFEICSIEVYLMESILQASTKVEFEEWKAALFFWHPPDDEIPQIESLKVSTPPTKHILPRPRHLSLGRVSEAASSKTRISTEVQNVKSGDLFVLDVTSKPLNAQNKVGVWRPIHCCIRPNGHFVQYNVGEKDKPFETIPLTEILRTHIWALDGSLFAKKHCFSIRSTHTQDVNYYTVSLKRTSTDQETFNSWLYALKFFAKAEVFGASAQLEYRLYRTFWIIINDGRILPKDLEAYCEIMLDDQRRARTSTRAKLVKGAEPDAPFWRDNFEFTDLSAVNKGITINVIQVKGSKLIPFGRTHIPVRSSDDCDEGWYPILNNNDRTRSTEHLGDLRLKLKYEEQIVLPIANYADLLDIIVNFRENNVISKLAELVTDLEGFSKNVLRILEGKGLAVVWLNTLIDEEIAEALPTRVNTLFRGNTLLTKALDAYMRLVGTEYLDDTLGDILRAICKNKVACEVDPSKLEKHEDLKTQWRILMNHTRTCWRAVTESISHFPKDLPLVFSHLQRRLTEKFSGQAPPARTTAHDQDTDPELASLARYTGVSGFVFLRLICPAILGPKLFHIVREHPEPRPHRTLTLIAKSLQGLANLVLFGTKESWMVPMNEFIEENTQSLKDFIDQICLSGISSGVGSSANSVRSLPIQPNSPSSTTSSIFRTQQGGSSKNSTGTTAGTGGSFQSGASMMLPLPSPSSQTRPSRPPFTKEGSNKSGNSINNTNNHNSNGNGNGNGIGNLLFENGGAELDRTNLDLPLLPHLIDLGKELSHFSTTVARVVPQWPALYKEQGDNVAGGANDNGDEDHDDEEEVVVDEDILRRVGRACWDIIETIQDRVEYSVQMEEQERRRAAQGYHGNNNYGSGNNVGVYSKSKVSREGSRDGEESYFVYEHDHQANDHDCESFEGYGRGSYDSEDESLEHSGHENNYGQ
ncbi:hypothetical protein BGZ92_006893 [Podila epicladia]|nr:hypothetical protein BGZ92_006893 [Podila epicladia]